MIIGDAVCSFNPVYGQGMSSAAQQALALAAVLQEGPHDLGRRAAQAFADIAAVPWALATGSDRRYPGQAPKPLPERLLDRYVDRLLQVAPGNDGVALAFMRVLHLLEPPPSLLTPSVAYHVLRGPTADRRPRRSVPSRAVAE